MLHLTALFTNLDQTAEFHIAQHLIFDPTVLFSRLRSNPTKTKTEPTPSPICPKLRVSIR